MSISTDQSADKIRQRDMRSGALLKFLAIVGGLLVASTCLLLLFTRQQASVTILHSFRGEEGGRTPSSSLAQGKDGTLFGAAWEGGPEIVGMLFGLSTDGEFRVLYPRTGTSPIVADDGYVYSVGLATDTNADQVLLRLQQDGGLSVLHAFPGGEARVWPAGGLVQAVDGHLYGMTQNGGERGHGSIYRISVDG